MDTRGIEKVTHFSHGILSPSGGFFYYQNQRGVVGLGVLPANMGGLRLRDVLRKGKAQRRPHIAVPPTP